MLRHCQSCKRARPLRDFDLVEDVRSPCRRCVQLQVNAEARQARQARLKALQQQRRALLVALVKVDAEIDAARIAPPRGFSSQQPRPVLISLPPPDDDFS